MSLFPSMDAAMTVRIKRQVMALMSYLMFLLPLVYAVQNGWMHFGVRGLVVVSCVALVVNLVFFLLIRTGASRHLEDPSMTFPQIIAALILALALVRYSAEARPVFLTLFFASFFFGVFGLTSRQFWHLAIGTIVAYALVVSSEVFVYGSTRQRMGLEILEFLALAMILCWMAAIGGYVARLRQNLYSQKSELMVAMARLRLLVSHDELTGVFNRRHLMQLLEHERACVARHAYPFSVCLLDIDHFKVINDTHGHATGDEVLREFSARMRQNARKMDWVGRNEPIEEDVSQVSVGRYGGEEFMVVMPHTPLAAASAGVDRLRAAILCTPFHTPIGPLEVRFSAGVAEYVPGESVETTIARADKALYRAKANGRNQTQLASVDELLSGASLKAPSSVL